MEAFDFALSGFLFGLSLGAGLSNIRGPAPYWICPALFITGTATTIFNIFRYLL